MVKKGEETLHARRVMLDSELEQGVWETGRYYIQTPRFDYLADLVLVSAQTVVLENVSVVFDSGAYDKLRAGKPTDAQFLTERAIFDRAGCLFFKMP